MELPKQRIRGSCLCGGVRFEIAGRWSGIGQCHCSKCRKVSGTASNAVLYASAKSLSWVAGEALVRDDVGGGHQGADHHHHGDDHRGRARYFGDQGRGTAGEREESEGAHSGERGTPRRSLV